MKEDTEELDLDVDVDVATKEFLIIFPHVDCSVADPDPGSSAF